MVGLMLKKFLYTLWIIILSLFVLLSIKNGSFFTFIEDMENRTFDIRQTALANAGIKKHNPNIVIVAIDDASYEYILDNYGEWPLKRDIYAKVTDYIQQTNPQSIAFDLMFVNSIKNDIGADKALVDIFKKYDNVYTSMNLDDQSEELRIAENLPDKLSINFQNKSKQIDLGYLEYTNCRVILSQIIDATSNIGMINVLRGDDGVLRKMPLALQYKDKYYPQLGLKVALNAMGLDYKKNFIIEKNSKMTLGNKTISIDTDGGVILNWYGPAGTFENIPLYKIIKAAEGKSDEHFDFNNKIIYFGATAASLFDIKTVPVDKVYPGVEVQATYVNNLLDGNLIHKTSPFSNIIIGLILALTTILCVVRIPSMPVALGLSVTIYAGYIMLTYYTMKFFNTWIEIVSPLMMALVAFIFTVIIKYLIKSRDFDQQYKLATTDGLTELYNHRYFQEQLKLQTSYSKRYNQPLSLIIIDIDYFKKFNDTYGHQSGDAVLKQVASELKKNVRAADIVCRYGGEEMSIILPNTGYEEAVNIANKLCTIIASKKCKLSNNRESNVTISLGVSGFGADGQTPKELIESADKRLYNAKENGRNRVN
ncbi:MAG: diguanylate cyclase [Cyanobacteria bacterium SIG26]|nr:diguanylate cyclase [Cyanobacteria bacterium SIG26]